MVLEGAFAVITGASRGIGRALAVRLAYEGANLVLVSRDSKALDMTAGECRSRCRKPDARIECLSADLSRTDEARTLGETIVSMGVEPDILVNNAGAALQGAAWETPDDEIERIFKTNVLSVMALCHVLIPGMASRRKGHIVNISSSAAAKPKGGMAVYGASKAAIAVYSLALAEEMAPLGIKVSTIYPGATNTSMLDDLRVTTPKGQWLEPEDIAEAVTFLLAQGERAVMRELHISPSRLSKF